MAKKETKPILETILLSTDDRPLEQWSKTVKNGYIKRIADEEITDKVLEINGASENVNISTPAVVGKSLGITKRWFCFQFKPFTERPFKFQVQCLDSTGVQRVFRFDTKLNGPKTRYFFTDVPFGYKSGWNSIEVDLKGLMRRCYCTDLSQVTRVQIHAACRLRRVYFSDAFYSDDSLPDDYKLIAAPLRQMPSPNQKINVEAVNSSNMQAKA